MYELFIGNYENVMGRIVYIKKCNKYIPCKITNYYFKTREFTLVPVFDMENIPAEEHNKRRLFKSKKIYIKVD